MEKREKVSAKEVLSAIPKSYGEIEPIERLLNCTRQAVKEILDSDEKVRREFEDEKERTLDRIIVHAKEDALAGDPKARDTVLKAEARERGYGDKLEIAGDKNQPLVYLHAVAVDLTANERNGFASKDKRIESWKQRASLHHEKQRKMIEGKTLEDVIQETAESNK